MAFIITRSRIMQTGGVKRGLIMSTVEIKDSRYGSAVRDANKCIARVTNVEEYLASVDKIYKRVHKSFPDHTIPKYNCELWFRGLKAEDYELVPKICRAPLNAQYETIYISRFKSKATPFLDRTPTFPFSGSPSSYWGWLFLMQHYGLPTRLLDWTQDALTALVFAVDPNSLDSHEAARDPAIWCLNPVRLNECFSFYEYFEKGYIPNVEEDMVYILFGPDSSSAYEGKPCAAIGPMNSPRIVAQKGAFTVFPMLNEVTPLNRFKDSGDYLFKITIDKDYRGAIQEQLRHYGITRQSLFPEIGMIAEEINTEGL
jgi:hypothetical protein